MSNTINFDPEDLTLDEVEEVETILGGSIDTVLSGEKPKAKALKAIVLVLTKRTDPSATMESVGSVKLSDLGLGNDQG
jgi:hypothetical protein